MPFTCVYVYAYTYTYIHTCKWRYVKASSRHSGPLTDHKPHAIYVCVCICMCICVYMHRYEGTWMHQRGIQGLWPIASRMAWEKHVHRLVLFLAVSKCLCMYVYMYMYVYAHMCICEDTIMSWQDQHTCIARYCPFQTQKAYVCMYIYK
jgi:hypothetical protein